jgi:hypothetical protein
VKRREPLPDLSRVLEDSRPNRPTAAISAVEKRIHTRFDKAFIVVIGSELYGDSFAIARNVSAGGILVEMNFAPPLGTIVTVHFQHVRGDDRLDEIVVRAEVKHHHYLNFTGAGEAASTRAIGLRFLDFVDAGDRIDSQCLH